METISVNDSLGVIDVRGTVTSVSPAREFNKSNSQRDKVVQDYYNVMITTDKNNRVKLYFPVYTHSTNKWKKGRSIDIFVRNEKNGEWIKYPLSSPKLWIGKVLEANGKVKKEGDRVYYMNCITKIKIF